MKITIPISKWYAFGNVDVTWINYSATLLDHTGMQCCLGHASVPRVPSLNNLLNKRTPAWCLNIEPSWMIVGRYNSDLAELAIYLNDAEHEWWNQPLEVRMGNLITVFAEGGDELEFICDEE